MVPTFATWRTTVVLTLALGLSAGASAAATWQVDPLDYVQYGLAVPPAMTFDAQDCPHIAYAGTSGSALYPMSLLHVSATTGGVFPTWGPTRLTGISFTGGGGGQAYLAAGGGSVYVGYRPYTRSPAAIPAAVFDGTTWTSYSVPQTSKGAINGLVTDNTGKPYWLINTETTKDASLGINTAGLYLTSKSSSGNQAVAVAAPFNPNVDPYQYTTPADAVIRQGSQAVLDAAGNVQTIQYYESGSNGYLLYAKGALGGPFAADIYADPTWQVKRGRPSIAVDAAGNPHIAYSTLWPSYGVRYATWTGSRWDGELIEQDGSTTGIDGTFPQVLLGGNGIPHVIYTDLLHGLLKHAFKDDGTWHIEAIDTISTPAAGGLLNGSLAAAMDSRGGIGVAYYDGGNWLKYAYLVPEPGTVALMLIGAVALARRVGRRRVA